MDRVKQLADDNNQSGYLSMNQVRIGFNHHARRWIAQSSQLFYTGLVPFWCLPEKHIQKGKIFHAWLFILWELFKKLKRHLGISVTILSVHLLLTVWKNSMARLSLRCSCKLQFCVDIGCFIIKRLLDYWFWQHQLFFWFVVMRSFLWSNMVLGTMLRCLHWDDWHLLVGTTLFVLDTNQHLCAWFWSSVACSEWISLWWCQLFVYVFPVVGEWGRLIYYLDRWTSSYTFASPPPPLTDLMFRGLAVCQSIRILCYPRK